MYFLRNLLTLISVLLFCCICLPATANDNVIIIADEITYLDQGTELKVTGNVKIQYGDYRLTTKELTYDKKNNLLTVNHPVELRDKDTFKIIASSAEISDLRMATRLFIQVLELHVRFVLHRQSQCGK